MKKNNEYIQGSTNVFKDLGFKNSDVMFAKAELARQINHIIKEKKLTPSKVAKILDIEESQVSSLNNGKLFDFSLEALFNFISKLE